MVYSLIIILLFIIIFYIFFSNYLVIKRENNKLKSSISKVLSISANDPAVEYLIHSLEEKINNLNKKVFFEKIKRKNIYSVLNNISEAIMLVFYSDDSNTLILDYANKSAQNLFVTSDFLGKTLSEILEDHNLIDIVLRSYRLDENISDEIIVYSPKKSFFHCEIKKIFLESEKNQNYRIVVLRDITKEKELDLMRREFLTIMSHELKTPLTVIHGYSETLLMSDEKLSSQALRFLNIIEDESSRLTRLINDLLDISRLERKDYEYHFKGINLSNLLKKINLIFNSLTKEMNINIYLDIKEDLTIIGDEDRLMQAIYNILDNAVKFTHIKESDKKEIFIRLYSEDNEVILEVEDTGIGIPERERNKIFNLFYRVDKSRTRQVPGTGLGLYIVKQILEKHRAYIEVDSEENQGTLVKIIFKRRNNDEAS
ncbi:two-component system, OmpR family, phosphate regulon sensor histidine kinase PhoR [Marinitoga hydrogenitolerans DSM 16785]|uniref:histidine kinase n=1 Tax=Marinitoga hydrogenitolerans (strain DSM 16785 / JCM 12826 / AT1271) TaxID=1122195 RepID=A0A1M4X0K8_MARH1|nr:ATP-binding protein [Marinitoga hydrogenitolerans]SHE87038.1 two-component system, OmpR family, phosphate regulon sensor histidine kinase PhoR [Marinitoga hydrogenitolerans DSM 16785]